MNSDEDDLIDSNSSEEGSSGKELNKTPSPEPNVSDEDAHMPAIRFQDLFSEFVEADTVKSIRESFDAICNSFQINAAKVFDEGFNYSVMYPGRNPNRYPPQIVNTRLIYKILQSKTNYWRANELWAKYDTRANSRVYATKSSDFKNLNVLIIGGGPAGMRLSIECALLGLKCTVIEKRDRFGFFSLIFNSDFDSS